MARSSRIAPLLSLMLICVFLGVGVALLVVQDRIPSSGRIITIGISIYKDSGKVESYTLVEWGALAPGDVVTKEAFIFNTGNRAVNVSLTNENYVPVEVPLHIGMAWDSEGVIIQPDEYHRALITLSVSPTITGIDEFTFDMVFTGEEQPPGN